MTPTFERNHRTAPRSTLSNGQPAHTRGTPRLRQSEIDRTQAWRQSEIRTARTASAERPSFLARLFGRKETP